MAQRPILTAVFTALLLAACGAPAPSVRSVSQTEALEAGPGILLLDVRRVDEYAEGHVPGAIHIPHDELAGRIGELEPYRDREVVVYCRSGRRAGIASGVLQQAGFARIGHLEGDMAAWQAAGLPLERGAP